MLLTALQPTSRCMHRENLGSMIQRVVTCPPSSSQPGAIQPAGVCKGIIWALWRNPCYLSFGHQSVPSLVPHNQQVYANGECGLRRAMPILRAPHCLQPYSQPAGACKGCRVIPILITPTACSPAINQHVNAKGQLKLSTAMCCYPSLHHQSVNSLAPHNQQV